MPEADERAFADGWFHSGDLCRMDDEDMSTSSTARPT